MALNFDKLISENENVSLEDLPIESLVQTDLDSNSNVFNKLFEDHLAILLNQTGNKSKSVAETIEKDDIFDLDLDGLEIDDNIEKSLEITEPLPPCYINLIDFACDSSNLEHYPDSDEIFSINSSDESDINKKNATVIRRQSTRIQNQTRKKIAEQIQRENIRLAKEAQRLNSRDYVIKSSIGNSSGEQINEASCYLSMPTDLDAEDELHTGDGEWKSDDDPNKLWCICKQPYEFRFMICCDNCSEWYHGDCVGVTQEEGARMEENGKEFICPICEKTTSLKKDTKINEPVVISDDEEDDNELLNDDGDDDCRIIKAVKPMLSTPNIFQIFKSSKPEINSRIPSKRNALTLSARTSICLNPGCKTLVNPKRSLYCSKKCIEKYTKMVKKNNQKEKVAQYGLVKGMKLAKMTRFVLAQIETETIQDEFDAPTEENLKEFLLKNPTYKVFQSAKSTKTKQDLLKSKKVTELLTKDAAKRIKFVKHFALIFKKTVSKTAPIEFRSIWQQCVNLEEALFGMCDKSINEKYISKAKELSELFKLKSEVRLSLDFLQEKILINDLLAMTKVQLEARCRTLYVVATDTRNQLKNGIHKKPFNATRTGISSLLADTTHLHAQHLYDINCKICNGTSKTTTENKQEKEAEKEKALEKENDKIKHNQKSTLNEKSVDLDAMVNFSSDSDNITPPTDSCSSESIVTSWFNKTSELGKNMSPQIINDEFKVTSTVETPDMAVDMELCSTPSASEPIELFSKNIEVKADSSSKPENYSLKSTNTKTPRQKLTSLWEGEIMYKEVGSIFCKTYLVSRYQLGQSKDESNKDPLSSTTGDQLRQEINLSANLGSQIKINGRTKLEVIKEYLTKLRKHSNKEFLVFRLHPSNPEEDRTTYLKMFDFFHGKDRCGVIDQKKLGLKDCFIYPLNAHSKIPSFFLPLDGPGFEKRRPHMLLMLIVRCPLEHNIYKSFSPKYDQEHEFVSNHGINLEKYFQPPKTPVVCPSPIPDYYPEEKPTEIVPEMDPVTNEDGDNNPVPSGTVPSKETQCHEEELSNKSDHDMSVKLSDVPDYIPEPSNHNHETSYQPLVEKQSEMNSLVNLDQVFSPKKLGNNTIPFCSNQEFVPKTVLNGDEIGNFSGDFDLRLISNNGQQHPTDPASVISFSLYTTSSNHKRFYTLYDAFFNEPDCQSKRAKYFYNPRYPSKSTDTSRSLR